MQSLVTHGYNSLEDFRPQLFSAPKPPFAKLISILDSSKHAEHDGGGQTKQ